MHLPSSLSSSFIPRLSRTISVGVRKDGLVPAVSHKRMGMESDKPFIVCKTIDNGHCGQIQPRRVILPFMRRTPWHRTEMWTVGCHSFLTRAKGRFVVVSNRVWEVYLLWGCCHLLFDFKSGGEVHSVVLVISPLVSLLVEQVGSLRKHGVSEAILSRNRGIDKCRLASDKDFEEGRFNLPFSAPDAIIGSDRWRAMLLKPSLCGHVVAVNEAHCVSKW